MINRTISRSAGRYLAVAAGLAVTAAALPATARDMVQTRLENANAEPDNWLHVNGNYSAHRFANLTQINASNVKNLTPKMMVLLGGQTPAIGGRAQTTRLEGTPLAEDGFLYVTDGWGALYKVDVRSGNRADFVWKMDPQTDKVWAGDVACCGINNRGAALWKDQVISNVLDGRTIATNKETGEVKWEVKLADPANAETFTVSPLVVRDTAISGTAGAEYGIRGFLVGADLNTGKEKWKTYTIPAKGEPGNETWKDTYNAWQTGGGSIWDVGTYDPKLNLMYWGTGNPAPQIDAEYRPGDNLFTDSMLAMNPDDGKVKWFFQYTPNDPYDYDEIGENPIIDLKDAAGKTSTLVIHAARNGHMYGFDRTNGQFLYGKAYVGLVTWTNGIDPKTGKPMSYNPNKDLQDYAPGTVARRGVVGTYCPALGGGKNWEPTAYNRDLEIFYVPSIEGCSAYVAQDKGQFEGMYPNGTTKKRTTWDGRGNAPAGTTMPIMTTKYSVNAINPRTGETLTKQIQDTKVYGLLATAGGLVFGGDQFGDLTAFDGKTLKPIWVYNVGTAIQGPPMSFAFQGKQYVAIMAGGTAGAGQTPYRPGVKYFTASNYLFVFGL